LYTATLCSLLGLTVAADDGGSSAPLLRLDEAIAVAIGNNRSLDSARLQVGRDDARLAVARSQRLPSLDLQSFSSRLVTPLRITYPAGGFGTYPGIGAIPGEDVAVESSDDVVTDLSVRLTQPLTQLHRLNLNAKAHALGRDAAEQELRTAALDVASRVRDLYYRILQANSALVASATQSRALVELDRVLAQNLAEETVLEHEALTVKARLAAETHNQLALGNSLATLKDELNVLLGRSVGSDFQVEELPRPSELEIDLEAARALALANRPELQGALLDSEQASYAHRIKKSEQYPDLSLVASYHTFFNAELLPSNFGQVGIVASWDPFDWKRRRHEIVEQELVWDQARNQVDEWENRIALEVAATFRRLAEARSLVGVHRLGREAAEARLRVTMSRHAEQAARLEEVLQTQAAFATADDQYQQALLELWRAKADFERAVGEQP
jgi:outer membrane protein TolC